MVSFALAVIMALSIVSTVAFADVKYVGNTQCGLQLTYRGQNWAKASGSSSTVDVSVTCKMYYDIIDGLGNRVMASNPDVRKNSGKGSAKTGSMTCYYWEGASATAKIGGRTLSTSVGFTK